jgi:hypothetical protein
MSISMLTVRLETPSLFARSDVVEDLFRCEIHGHGVAQMLEQMRRAFLNELDALEAMIDGVSLLVLFERLRCWIFSTTSGPRLTRQIPQGLVVGEIACADAPKVAIDQIGAHFSRTRFQARRARV